MKKIKDWKHQKEFDTKTLITDIGSIESDSKENSDGTEKNDVSGTVNHSETREAVDLKTLSGVESETSEGKVTQVYEPRPLTPDDDIYDDIIEQFASAPTKPKYWFEEFGDYWSCSCGHINKGDTCKSCGLERELLRSLFILHKPADSPGKLNKKLNKAAKEQVDKEERQHVDKENRRKQRESSGEDDLKVIPIETGSSEVGDASDDSPERENESAEVSENENDHDDAKAESSGADMPDTDENDISLSSDILSPSYEKNPVKRIRIGFKAKIIIAIVSCLILIGGCGAVIYYYMAAPAMQYQDAKQLQADGKYEKAIAKYKALGDYKDCEDLIWECYCLMGDQYFDEGEFQKAIDTYNTALDLKEDETLHDKIWQCYLGIGDQYMAGKDYEKALSTYYVASDLKDNETVQEKINAAKFNYVKTYQDDRTAKVEEYMSDLMAVKYSGIQEIYDSYYAWHVKIVANTSESDYSTDVSSVSRKDTVYFHSILSGGEPSEHIMLYYEVIWPNGASQIYDLDSSWKDGSKITARFQYPIPLFGKEGKLTFKLYDKSTNEQLGSDTVTFKN